MWQQVSSGAKRAEFQANGTPMEDSPIFHGVWA
jgi:hypothetical protein